MKSNDVLLENVETSDFKIDSGITKKDLFWIRSRGGRGLTDIEVDELGRKFYYSWTRDKTRIYFPNEYMEKIVDTPGMYLDKFGVLHPFETVDKTMDELGRDS